MTNYSSVDLDTITKEIPGHRELRSFKSKARSRLGKKLRSDFVLDSCQD